MRGYVNNAGYPIEFANYDLFRSKAERRRQAAARDRIKAELEEQGVSPADADARAYEKVEEEAGPSSSPFGRVMGGIAKLSKNPAVRGILGVLPFGGAVTTALDVGMPLVAENLEGYEEPSGGAWDVVDMTTSMLGGQKTAGQMAELIAAGELGKAAALVDIEGGLKKAADLVQTPGQQGRARRAEELGTEVKQEIEKRTFMPGRPPRTMVPQLQELNRIKIATQRYAAITGQQIPQMPSTRPAYGPPAPQPRMQRWGQPPAPPRYSGYGSYGRPTRPSPYNRQSQAYRGSPSPTYGGYGGYGSYGRRAPAPASPPSWYQPQPRTYQRRGPDPFSRERAWYDEDLASCPTT